MDPRSEVVIRQHEYLSGRVLLVNAPTDDLLSNLIEDISPCFWTWNYNEFQYFQSATGPMYILGYSFLKAVLIRPLSLFRSPKNY